MAACLLALYAGWMRWRMRLPGDRVKMLYERFCRRAARLGARRDPWEGPSDFAARAFRLIPKEAERIRQISENYIALRYSPTAASSLLNTFAKEVKAFRNS
jgi:hypothetical protein